MVFHQEDNAESLRRWSRIVGCWCLAICLLPPGGLIWQFAVVEALGHWFVDGVLASNNLAGLVR